MKTVRTVQQRVEKEEEINLKPKFEIGSYRQVYYGEYEDHCFTIKDVRYNHDLRYFEYLGLFGIGFQWMSEKQIV